MTSRDSRLALREAIRVRYGEAWGRPSTVFTPQDDERPRITVVEFAPRQGREYWVYATVGMATRPQHMPDGAPDWTSPRVELFTYVPEQARWPVEILNLTARLPFENTSWLYWWHTVDCRGPLEEGVASELTALLLLPPYFEDEGFDALATPEGTVRFLLCVPVTEAERRFALARGGQALEEKLLEENVPVVYRRDRSSVV